MIPSDHFVRFYNEVFKFLDKRDGLEKYYQAISRHQEHHCLENFRKNGLDGVISYYQVIRKEENCGLEMERGEHFIRFNMTKCPSLSKAMDNDAGACEKYCMHCPGWTAPLYQKAGIFMVYDVMSMDDPRCRTYLFDDKALAQKCYDEQRLAKPDGIVLKNW